MSDLYDRDFYAWAIEQATLLRSGQLSAADIEHIAEEIESLGRSEKRELVSRVRILLLQMLKSQHQPERQGISWRLSIENARDDIAEHLDDNPSLKAKLHEVMLTGYRHARRDAAIETGIGLATFPAECPWTFEQAMTGALSED